MNASEYQTLVNTIEDWWGPARSWEGAVDIAEGFGAVDYASALAILQLRRSDPEIAKYPPNPAELAAAAHRYAADHTPSRVLAAPCDHTYDGRWMTDEEGYCARCKTWTEGEPA